MDYCTFFLPLFYALATQAARGETGKLDPDGTQVHLEGWVTWKALGWLASRQCRDLTPGGQSANLTLYSIGLQDDGNGNSRSQPLQGRDLNGMSSSHSTDKLTTVHKTHLQAFSTQLCLSSNTLLETIHPFPALCGDSVGTCRGHMPREASPQCSPLPGGQDAPWWHCRAPARPSEGVSPASCRGARSYFRCTELFTFHSQLRAGEIQCPKLLRLQTELPEISSAFTQLQRRLGCAGKLWGSNLSVHQVLSSSAPLRDC